MSSPLPSAAAPGIELIGVSKTFPTASGKRVRAIDNVEAIAAIRDPPNRHDLTASSCRRRQATAPRKGRTLALRRPGASEPPPAATREP